MKAAPQALCTGIFAAGFLCGPATSAAAALTRGPAEVRLRRDVSGRTVIYNESLAQRARRFSAQMVPVPDVALVPLIARHSGARGLDARLVRAVIQVESGYNQRARSNKGAMGLMQLMPETAVELAVRDPYDPDQNLRGGTAYLRQLLDLYSGSLEKALAAYNAGPGAVDRHGGVPPYPDTIDYVRRVLALYQGAPGGSLLWQARAGAAAAAEAPYRPAYATRGGNGRILVTSALSGVR